MNIKEHSCLCTLPYFVQRSKKLANIIEMKDSVVRNFLEENKYDALHQRWNLAFCLTR